jgi:putative membrane-bound dehydrogenase-like protein
MRIAIGLLLSICLLTCVRGRAEGEEKASPPAVTANVNGREIAFQIPPPQSPQEALASFVLRRGIKIELVAAEPLVVDPVAFDWGPDGRLWVVEMRDYPNGIDWHKPGDALGKPGGRVKVLTDTNGDGKYDKADVFLDELPFPTGIKVWRKGVLVSAAPDILYAEDTDGDNRADVKKALYRGFGEGNQQHRVNGLRWGVDNWLYIGNGDSGGKIKSLVTEKELDIRGRDLRIRPDTGEFEAQSGQTQFGRSCDDWGNWFGGNNSNPMWHYVLDDHYLRRNPNSAAPDVRKQVSTTPGASPVFPASSTLARFNDFHAANRFTSACSPIVYRDNHLGDAFAGNAFICEPVHNLVHREVMRADGLSFTSQRAEDEQNSEFLASRDNWFRPVMIRTGPDGALWLADMYRFIIEHPQWIPAEIQKQVDLRLGADRGRIYRIVAADRPARKFPRLEKSSASELVAALDSPNGWTRDMAQQLLLWRQDKEAAQPLQKLVRESAHPTARLHALWTLEGLGELDEPTLLAALADADERMVRHAYRASETHLNDWPIVHRKVRTLPATDDKPLLLQAICTQGEIRGDVQEMWGTGMGLALCAAAYRDDPLLLAAVFSSLNEYNAGGAAAVAVDADRQTEKFAGVAEKILATCAAVASDATVKQLLEVVLVEDAQATADRKGRSLRHAAAVLEMVDRRKAGAADLLDARLQSHLAARLKQARELLAAEPAANDDAGERLAAIRLLGRVPSERAADIERLTNLLTPQNAVETQSQAIARLAQIAGEQTPTLLFAGWASHTPPVRGQILDLLLGREAWTKELVAAFAAKKLPAAELDARRRQLLLTHKNDAIRAAAEKALAGSIDANRQAVVAKYQAQLASLSADAAQGKLVYAKKCSQCHRLENAGHVVGPDLAALTSRSRDVLLTAILDPNRAVEDRFLDFQVRRADGSLANGMLAAESGASITLVAAEGKQISIPRSEVEALRSTGKSLMPEGMEKEVPPADMAHLLAYLQGFGPAPKSFPNNKPAVVKAGSDGSLVCSAQAARIYGPQLVLEEKHKNLGYWSHLEDQAAWSLVVPADGEYRVRFEYACDNGAAGNRFALTIGGQSLPGQIAGTGGWDQYKTQEIGRVKLRAGEAELVIRPTGALRTALMDLKSVRLDPVK